MSGCVAAVFFFISGDFWSQFSTFFWQAEPVVVTANSLHTRLVENKPMGTVTFEATRGQPRTFSDYLSKGFMIDPSAKTAAFIASYAPGTTHIAYIAPDGSRASLGHFPREHSLLFGVLAIVHLTIFTIGIFRWNAVPYAKQAVIIEARKE